MRRSIGYGSMITFAMIQIVAAPWLPRSPAAASTQARGTMVQAVAALEAGRLEASLLDAAAGRGSLENGPAEATEAVAPARHRISELTGLPAPQREAVARRPERVLLPTVPRFQALAHLVTSHLGIVTRPVTAGKRLFFLVYDTVKDALGWPAVPAPADGPGPGPTTSGTMDLDAWEGRLDEITGSETSYGTLEFLIDGREFFPRLFHSVSAARRSVHIRIYIFDNDDVAVRMADTLKRRSENIDVRVLMDGLGTILATGVMPESLPPHHEPPLSMRTYLMSGSKVKVRQQSNPWFTGDHSKMVIIDDEKAYIGGMNIGREYRYEWHDLMVEVEGPVVGEMGREFDRAWANGGLLGDFESLFHSAKRSRERGSPHGYPVRLLHTKPGDSQIRNAQLEAIRWSRKYVYLENPYLADDQVLDELIRASNRGVDVRVVLPGRSNSGIFTRSNVLAANRMLENGIKVYHLPRMSHVKAAVYDGWACFGSANFDKYSFRVHYEVNMATSHEPVVRELIDRLFIPDFNASQELTEELPVKAHDFLLELVADQL